MKRVIVGVLVTVLAAGGFAFTRTDIHRIYLPTATGITAKQVCSLHFVTGLPPERARALYLDPLLGEAGRLVSAEVGDDEVRSDLVGVLYGQRAVYREGIGCTLVHSGRDFNEDLALPMERSFEPMALDTAHRAAHFDAAALAAAIDTAFAEPERGFRNTLAVIVLHDGHLVAERYGEGIGRARDRRGRHAAGLLLPVRRRPGLGAAGPALPGRRDGGRDPRPPAGVGRDRHHAQRGLPRGRLRPRLLAGPSE